MDERIERHLRDAHDPVSMAEVCAMMLSDPARHHQIRTMLHPHVRQHIEAREVFLEVLPLGIAAFCIRCRELLELNEDGIPVGKVVGRPRRARKLCTPCESERSKQMGRIYGRGPYHTQLRDGVAKAFDKMLYCGRCGAAARPGHACGRKLPSWVTGGENLGGDPGGGWVKWREA